MRSVARRHATDSQAGAGKVPFFEACLLASDQPIPLGTPVVHRTARTLDAPPIHVHPDPVLSLPLLEARTARERGWRASHAGERMNGNSKVVRDKRPAGVEACSKTLPQNVTVFLQGALVSPRRRAAPV